MKILTNKKQKKILELVTLLEIESIKNVDTEAIPIFAGHLTEISLIVGGVKGMADCFHSAIALSSETKGE